MSVNAERMEGERKEIRILEMERDNSTVKMSTPDAK